MDVGGSSRFTPIGTTSFGDPNSGFPAVTTSQSFENTDIAQSPTEETLDILSATLEYEFDTLGLLTATYSQFKRDIYFTFDSSPILFFFGVPIPGVTAQPQNRDIDFLEVRFASSLDSPLQFLLGVSASNEKTQFETNVVTINAQGIAQPFIPGPANDALSNPNGTTFFGRFVDNDIKQAALFGEASYRLSEDLNITFGGRYFDSEQKSIEGRLHDFGSAEADNPPFNNSSTDSRFTGKVAIAYSSRENLNFYGNISQGFRVGGLNNSDSLFVDDVPNSFDSDLLTNYEVGMKSLLDRGTLNVSLYLIDWNDIQLETVAGSAFPFTTNAGDARMQGIEVDFSYKLSHNLDLQAGGSYTHARLTSDQPEVDAGEDRGFSGDRIPNVPEIQAFTSVIYNTTLSYGELNVRGDLSYRSDSDIRFDTSSANNFTLAASTLINMTASLSTSNDLVLAFYIKNLTDEEAHFDAISSSQDPLAVIAARPRTIGININKHF